ncbi:MAG: hypothetical protein FGM15_11345 [Chthoniobacterales bacterium]|nr:hypothetical protein [Chthoniobacterales bacterium]
MKNETLRSTGCGLVAVFCLAAGLLCPLTATLFAVTPTPNEFAQRNAWLAPWLDRAPTTAHPRLELLFEDAFDDVSRRSSWRGTPFQLGEKTYANGLAFNSTKHFRVVLGRPAERFTAEVGLENNDDTRKGAQSGNGSVTFHVLVDGKEVASTPCSG